MRSPGLVPGLDCKKHIDQWRGYINSQISQTGFSASLGNVHDFRLVLDKTKLVIECRTAPDTDYQPLKAPRLRQLFQQHTEGSLQVAPEAQSIWEPVSLLRQLGLASDLQYSKTEVRRLINSLVRIPSLHERILTAERKPYQRATDSIRWDLTAATSDTDDYRLRLVTPDNNPLPPILMILPGQPTYYVTHDTIHPGTAKLDRQSDLGAELVIPAPAIETRDGAQFLMQFGVPMPPRLQAKVETDPMRVTIACNLIRLSSYGTTEAVQIHVSATGEKSGATEHYSPSGWNASHTISKKKSPSSAKIHFADRSQMAPVPALVAQLGPSWDQYDDCWRLRVARNFADKFAGWLKSLPPEIEVKLDRELATIANEPVSASVNLDCAPAGVDWFDLKVVLNVTDTTLTQDELNLLLNARGGFVRLGAKGWRRLQYNISEDDDARLAKLGLSATDFSAETQRLHALQLADDAAQRLLPEEQVAEIRRRADEIQTRVTPPIPAAMLALRTRRDGLAFLAHATGDRATRWRSTRSRKSSGPRAAGRRRAAAHRALRRVHARA